MHQLIFISTRNMNILMASPQIKINQTENSKYEKVVRGTLLIKMFSSFSFSLLQLAFGYYTFTHALLKDSATENPVLSCCHIPNIRKTRHVIFISTSV